MKKIEYISRLHCKFVDKLIDASKNENISSWYITLYTYKELCINNNNKKLLFLFNYFFFFCNGWETSALSISLYSSTYSPTSPSSSAANEPWLLHHPWWQAQYPYICVQGSPHLRHSQFTSQPVQQLQTIRWRRESGAGYLGVVIGLKRSFLNSQPQLVGSRAFPSHCCTCMIRKLTCSWLYWGSIRVARSNMARTGCLAFVHVALFIKTTLWKFTTPNRLIENNHYWECL